MQALQLACMVGFFNSSCVRMVALFASLTAYSSAAAAQPSSYPAEPPPPSNPSGAPRTPSPTPPPGSPIEITPQPDDELTAPPTAATGSELDQPIDLNAAPPDAATPSALDAATSGKTGVPIVTMPYVPPTEDLIVSNRELGGHHFPLAVFVPPALTFSYFGVRAGLEYHRVPGFSRDISFFASGFSRATLETVNAAETVDVALRLHEYIALLGTAYGLARVGANEQTLLGTGADYTYGGDVGVLIKLFRVAGFQLALRGEAGYFAGQRAGIIELFQDIGDIVRTNIDQLAMTTDVRTIDLPARLASIENAIRVATSAILTPFHGFEYGGALNAAQSLGPAMGLQLSFGLYGKTTTYDVPVFDATAATVTADPQDVNQFSPRFAVAFDVDLESSLGIPLDLVAEYMLNRLTVQTALPSGTQERSWIEHTVALGGYYAGSLNLQLGLIAYMLLGQNYDVGENAQPSGEPLDVGAQFVFRYLR
jgi:hypothetical protein